MKLLSNYSRQLKYRQKKEARNNRAASASTQEELFRLVWKINIEFPPAELCSNRIKATRQIGEVNIRQVFPRAGLRKSEQPEADDHSRQSYYNRRFLIL